MYSLCLSHTFSPPPSLPSCLPASLPPSLPPSLHSFLPPCLPASLPPSLPPSLPSFLPPSITPYDTTIPSSDPPFLPPLSSVVKEEIADDDMSLPNVNGRVVCWVRHTPSPSLPPSLPLSLPLPLPSPPPSLPLPLSTTLYLYCRWRLVRRAVSPVPITEALRKDLIPCKSVNGTRTSR